MFIVNTKTLFLESRPIYLLRPYSPLITLYMPATSDLTASVHTVDIPKYPLEMLNLFFQKRKKKEKKKKKKATLISTQGI